MIDIFYLLAILTVRGVSKTFHKRRKEFFAAWIVYNLYKMLTRRRRLQTLRGKVAVITGGAGGLGRVMANKLTALGVKVICWDLNEKLLADVAASVAGTRRVDVTDRQAVLDAGVATLERWGHVDLLINNAGVQSNKSVIEMQERDLSLNFGVNVFGQYWTCQAFVPSMMERNSGAIVCVSSMTAFTPTARLSHYAGSKMAVAGMMHALDMELKDYSGVTTTVVCPFKIDTGMFDDSETGFIPPLKVDSVADSIIEAAVDQTRMVILPSFFSWYYYIARFVPLSIVDRVVPTFFAMKHD